MGFSNPTQAGLRRWTVRRMLEVIDEESTKLREERDGIIRPYQKCAAEWLRGLMSQNFNIKIDKKLVTVDVPAHLPESVEVEYTRDDIDVQFLVPIMAFSDDMLEEDRRWHLLESVRRREENLDCLVVGAEDIIDDCVVETQLNNGASEIQSVLLEEIKALIASALSERS